MHSKSLRTSCAMIAAVAGFSLMPAAWAQGQDIPDHKLDAVAAAAKDVSAVGDSYKKKLAQAPEADQERIVGEADNAMLKAITDKGLSIEEYKSIIQVAQKDPVLRDKLIQRLK